MNRTVKSIKKQLKMSISQVTDAPESYVRSPGKDFSRNRKLTMQKMVESILVMGGSDLKCELMDFFKFSPDTPSNAAFVKRRGLISSKAFEHIFNSFTAACNQLKLFKGYRLLAVDGSDLHIPTNKEEPDNFYPAVNGQKSYSLLHLNAMYDLLQNIYIDAVIQESRKQNEHAAFVKMIDRYDHSVPSIFIADRGFESYNNIAHVQESGNYYLIRIKNAKKGFAPVLIYRIQMNLIPFSLVTLLKRKPLKQLLPVKNSFLILLISIIFPSAAENTSPSNLIIWNSVSFDLIYRIQSPKL